MSAIARAEPGQKHEPGTPSRSPRYMAGTQALRSLSLVIQVYSQEPSLKVEKGRSQVLQ